MTVLRSGSASHVGQVRSVNQDRALETPNLFAVADGMGGHAGGEVAAEVAVATLEATFAVDATADGLRRAVAEANAAVWRRGHADAELRGMGTTLTAVALVAGADGRDVLVMANVGDSRGYLFSDGELTQVTADHSLAEEKVRHGEMSEAEAAVHPHRHILTRALGVSDAVEPDLWELHASAGDRLLLCSDGLTNEVAQSDMVDVLTAIPDPTEAASELVDQANESGGNDNITVVVVDVLVGEPDGAAPRVIALSERQELLPRTPADDHGPDQDGDGDPGLDADTAGRAPTVPGEGSAGGEAPAGAGAAAGPFETGAVTGGGAGVAVSAIDEPPLAGTPAPAQAPARVDQPAPEPPNGAGASLSPTKAPATGAPRPEARRETRRERRRRLGVPRRITFRVVLFFLLVAGLVAGGYVFVRWYAMDNWYVTIRHQELVIYQGRPGGLLWFEPKIVDRTGVPASEVLAVHLPELRANVQEPTLADARTFVRNLHAQYRSQQATPASPPAAPATTAPPTGGSP